MKFNRTVLFVAILVCLPLLAEAHSLKMSQAVERAVNQAVVNAQTPKYYVPLVQLNEEEPTPGADGAEAGIMWVEIGMETDADGNSPIFWSLTSKRVVIETSDGPMGPFLEEIDPKIFNEAYRRYASDPRSAKATVNQTKQMLTKYYRQVQAERKATPANTGK